MEVASSIESHESWSTSLEGLKLPPRGRIVQYATILLPSPVPISRTTYEPLQLAAQPGLLLHFTECAYVLFLSGYQFAFREGPVVVRRPVNDGDLDRTLTLAPHDPPTALTSLSGRETASDSAFMPTFRTQARGPFPGNDDERKVNNSYRCGLVDILAARALSSPPHRRRDRDHTERTTEDRVGPTRPPGDRVAVRRCRSSTGRAVVGRVGCSGPGRAERIVGSDLSWDRRRPDGYAPVGRHVCRYGRLAPQPCGLHPAGAWWQQPGRSDPQVDGAGDWRNPAAKRGL